MKFFVVVFFNENADFAPNTPPKNDIMMNDMKHEKKRKI